MSFMSEYQKSHTCSSYVLLVRSSSLSTVSFVKEGELGSAFGTEAYKGSIRCILKPLHSLYLIFKNFLLEYVWDFFQLC